MTERHGGTELTNTLLLAGGIGLGLALVVWVLFGTGAKLALMLGVLAAAVVLVVILWRGSQAAQDARAEPAPLPEPAEPAPVASDPEPAEATTAEPAPEAAPAETSANKSKPTADDILTGQRASEAAFNAPMAEDEPVKTDKSDSVPSGEGSKPEGLSAARDGQPDDLKRIKGVGPKLEALLNELGYFHFDQIAAWNADEVAWVDQNLKGFKGRVTRDSWVAQAAELAQDG